MSFNSMIPHWIVAMNCLVAFGLQNKGTASAIHAIEHEHVIGRRALATDGLDDLVPDDASKDSTYRRNLGRGKGGQGPELLIGPKVVLLDDIPTFGQPLFGSFHIFCSVFFIGPPSARSGVVLKERTMLCVDLGRNLIPSRCCICQRDVQHVSERNVRLGTFKIRKFILPNFLPELVFCPEIEICAALKTKCVDQDLRKGEDMRERQISEALGAYLLHDPEIQL